MIVFKRTYIRLIFSYFKVVDNNEHRRKIKNDPERIRATRSFYRSVYRIIAEELKRVFNADYDLCAALLTMILREDHFSSGSFKQRFAAGQVLPILNRMRDLLCMK